MNLIKFMNFKKNLKHSMNLIKNDLKNLGIHMIIFFLKQI